MGLEIYTDGSEKMHKSSWAYVWVKEGQVVKEDSGLLKGRSATQMEFEAAIRALSALKEPTQAVLYSDSRVVVDTVSLWLPEWKQNGWRPRGKKSRIAYLDQIQELDKINQVHQIVWRWIPAHRGNMFNERCDALCRQARD